MVPSSSKPPTRADVARLAGVSPAVVSYTLNGGPRGVDPAKAQRVRDAVAALGYVPNLTAQALSRGTRDAVGLIVPDLENPLSGRVASQVQRTAEQHGMALILVSTMTEPANVSRFLPRLDALHLAGIIVATDLDPRAVAAATHLRSPLVQLISTGHVDAAAQLQVDPARVATLLLDHLVELGHESIAFLGDSSRSAAYTGPWRDTHLRRHARPGPERYVADTREAGYDAVLDMLASELPTAVFATSAPLATGALRALLSRGVRVPEEVSIVSFDDYPETAFTFPALTTARVPLEDMARDAARLLVAPDVFSTETRWYEPSLVVRESTAPPRIP